MRAIVVLAALAVPAVAWANPGPPPSSSAGGMAQCRTDRAALTEALAGCTTDLAGLEAELGMCFDDVADLDAALDACEDRKALVSARTGGLAMSKDGRAFVSFPPGAVATDTRVIVTDVPKPPGVAKRLTGVYDFTPDGLTMDNEATICFQLDARQAAFAGSVGAGTTCLGYYDEKSGEWKCEDECLDAVGEKQDLLCGTTSHFTNFAILLGGASSDDGCSSADDFVGVINATTGGAIGLDDRSAFVNVPPKALLRDTEFTFEVVEKPIVEVARASAVVDIGPDGARFLAPITVCLEVDPGRMKDDACLAFLDVDAKGGPAWVCEDTKVTRAGDNLVCGTTDHLTPYTIALGLSQR